MEIVTKEEYWTTILNDPTQFGQITTEDTEFNSIANDVWNVLENSFIKIDDEESVIKWEETTGLSGEGLTIFQRKVNILYTLTVKNYLPISLFTQAMDRLVGEDDYELLFDKNNNALEIKSFENKSIPYLMTRLIPKNITSEFIEGIPGLFDIEYIESTGEQYFSIPFQADASKNSILIETEHWSAPVYITFLQEGSGNKMGMGVFDYSKYYIISGGNGFATGYLVYENWNTHKTLFEKQKVTIFLPDGTSAERENMESARSVNYWLFKANYGNSIFPGRKRTWRAWIDGELKYDLLPAIDTQGYACMYDKISKNKFYNEGTGDFTIGLNVNQALRLLSRLPIQNGVLKLSLPWEAQLVITGVPELIQSAVDKGWTITTRYHEGEGLSPIFNKYKHCQTISDMSAVNPDYKEDLTIEGEWIYPLPLLKEAQKLFSGAVKLKKVAMEFPKVENAVCMFLNSGIEHLELSLPKATNAMQIVSQCKYLSKKFKVVMPICTSGDSVFYGVSCTEIYADIPSMTWMPYGFSSSKIERVISPHENLLIGGNNDGYGGSYLSIFPWKLPNLKNGNYLFSGSVLNKESTLRILNSIPNWTDGQSHLLTMGIHIDHQFDEDVLAAIENAESKNWTMTVKWNGVPTTQSTSTFGLRGRTIYAKPGRVKEQDGTYKDVLDWGHYVTNWEENGYQEFASIEEAENYFNIKEEINE